MAPTCSPALQAHTSLVLGFVDYAKQSRRLADQLQVPFALVDVHAFPDGESRIRVPPELPEHVVLCRSLNQPNAKLVELTLAAEAARSLGVRKLTLVCPYLCYMRQDIAFHFGEAISQQIIGRHLARLFDEVVTVDPHLHRVTCFDQAVPARSAVALSASAPMGEFLARELAGPLLIGPDDESKQWVSAIAEVAGFDHCVASKERSGDREVVVTLPDERFQDRTVVLVDDVASTGHTLAAAAQQVRQRGARQVFVAVTHALFVGNSMELLATAGVEKIWSTDSVDHPSNVVPLASLLADTLVDV